jgi:prepilin-type N-terminal cleavage/methylation domain-containing protein
MMQHNRRDKGVTLVELLVVLAIIGILTTASIPVMSRLGAFSANRNNGAARDLFTILKAAQIYAAAHNTDTAVIYSSRNFTDSWDDGSSPAFDSYMVVRRLKKDEEISRWTYQALYDLSPSIGENDIVDGLLGENIRQNFVDHYEDELNIPGVADTIVATDIFVPIRNADKIFKEFPRETCLLIRPNPDLRGQDPDDNDSTDQDDPFWDRNTFHKNTGMTRILVFNPWVADGSGELTGQIVYPPSNPKNSYEGPTSGFGNDPNEVLPEPPLVYGDGTEEDEFWQIFFPAHVFKPTGEMLRADGFDSKERVTLYFGVKPDTEPDDRFFADPNGDGNNPFQMDDHDLIIPLITEMKLYLATGRAKIEK